MAKVKDKDIIECLNEGMNYHDIAKKYGMNHQSVYQRIRKMKETGRIPDGGVKQVFHKMDTVVRKKDRQWFRITEINDDMGIAELAVLHFGETIGSKKANITVQIADLERNFEKKDYPKVDCYNLNDIAPGVDPDNVECYETFEEPEGNIPEPEYKPEYVAFSAETKETFGDCVMVDKAEHCEMHKPEGFVLGVPCVTLEFAVSRQYLQKIDKILDAVDPAEATDDELVKAKELIACIIVSGIQAEIDG